MSPSDAVMRRRGGRGLYKAPAVERRNPEAKRKVLPEYLTAPTIEKLINGVEHPPTKLAMMIQWRAGLRVSELVSLAPSDVELRAEPRPQLKVRQGKGGKDRLVPLHPELVSALSHAMYLDYTGREPFFGVTRQTIHSWYKRALRDAGWPAGNRVTTHTFRHSAARHWVLTGVPINVVSKWLGHSNLSTTMIYLELVSDPGGYMERVP